MTFWLQAPAFNELIMAKNLNSTSIHSGTSESTGKLYSLKRKFMKLDWHFKKSEVDILNIYLKFFQAKIDSAT